jgi:hypothetical protein
MAQELLAALRVHEALAAGAEAQTMMGQKQVPFRSGPDVD